MANGHDDKITKIIGVPAWMVYGACTVIAVLSGGPVYQLVRVGDQVHDVRAIQARDALDLQQKIAEANREIAAIKVKQDDIVSALKSINTELHSLNKSMTILSSRMPE